MDFVSILKNDRDLATDADRAQRHFNGALVLETVTQNGNRVIG